MDVTKSQHFGEAGEQAEKVLRLHGNALASDERKSLEVQQKRARTLAIIENLTGLKFDVFRKADPRIAAFITVAGKETHIAEQTLDDPVWAAYAAWHETMHKKTANFMNMGKYRFLGHDYFETVNEEIGDSNIQLGNFSVVEAFTDLLTAQEHGEHPNSGYLEREVPAAEKLEELCLKMTGNSLAEAFRMNNVALFHQRLERLGEVLLMRKAFDDFAEKDRGLEGFREQMEQKMKDLKPIVKTVEDAERFVGKMIAECIAIKEKRVYFGLDENLSSLSASGGMLS